MRSIKKSQKAFTLMEIMVVVIVIGVLATVALTSFSKTMQQQKRERTSMIVRTISSGWYMYVTRKGFDHDLDGDELDISEINQYTGLNIIPESTVTYSLQLDNYAAKYIVNAVNSSPSYTITFNSLFPMSSTNPSCSESCP